MTKMLLQNLTEENRNGNLVISPMSILMLLGILADATNGKSREEVLRMIGIEIAYDELMLMLGEFQSNMMESGSLVSSNAVCVNSAVCHTMTEGYEERLKKIFDGSLFVSSNIVDDVNAWVKDRTRGMINQIADPSMNHMLACLINAIVFESEWKESYGTWNISEDRFYNADGTVSYVQMLKSREDAYIEDDDFTGFLKPYKDRKYTFMALLPKEKETGFPLKKKKTNILNGALKQIDFMKLFREITYTDVNVTMPEFTADFDVELNELLQKQGVRTLFTSEADFSPLSGEFLNVDSVLHKAHIEVGRKGTKAAAVTAAMLQPGCSLADRVEPETVRLDRPFVYAIINKEMGIPVFAGLCNQIENERRDR